MTLESGAGVEDCPSGWSFYSFLCLFFLGHYGPATQLLLMRNLATDHSEIRDKLASCLGGSVDLEKNEDTGIAVMTFNNTKAKNAYSGKYLPCHPALSIPFPTHSYRNLQVCVC